MTRKAKSVQQKPLNRRISLHEPFWKEIGLGREMMLMSFILVNYLVAPELFVVQIKSFYVVIQNFKV